MTAEKFVDTALHAELSQGKVRIRNPPLVLFDGKQARQHP
jgi:hypothetical protein